jgi:hypothetical protein
VVREAASLYALAPPAEVLPENAEQACFFVIFVNIVEFALPDI